jgi:hypothetical protein
MSSAAPSEIEKNLQERFGITAEEMRNQIKPLFMFMLDHGMTSITIDRTGTQCLLSVDGKQI